MRLGRGIRWLAVITSTIPGIWLGMIGGQQVCFSILRSVGMGNSHNDMFTVALAELCGAVVGGLLFPSIVFVIARPKASAPPPR